MAFFDTITKIRLNGTDMDEVYLNSNKVYPPVIPTPKLYLEYIESTGTQIINTLVDPSIDTEVIIDFQFTESGKGSLFGSRKQYNQRGYMLGSDRGTIPNVYYMQLGSGWVKPSQTDFNRHVIDFNKNNTGEVYIDNSKVTTFTRSAFTAYAPIYLFGDYDGENGDHIVYGACKIYSCKIYESEVLIKDYVPVLDQNDVACLYDKVNKEFIYNSGTGDFSYSLTNSYAPVQYLKNTGRTQYIDTNYVYTSNSARIDTKFQQTETRSDAVFGYYYNSGYYKTVLTAHNGNYYISNYNPTGTTYSIGVDHEISAIINGNSNRTGTYTITEGGNIISSGNQVGIFPDSSTRNTMLLFAQQVPNGLYKGPVSKIYYFKMWDNDVLVRDLIPVLKENSVPCMYDRVTKQFYLNAGTGTFDYE